MGHGAKFTITRREADILSTQHFVYEIFNLHKLGGISETKLLYRGVSNCRYTLTPSIGRKCHQYAGKTVSLTISEKNLLHRFRRRAYPHVERAITAGEAIFIARHHMLPTRLLDWTANALFALYFACQEHHEHDGKVWAMLRVPDEKYDIDAFEIAQKRTERELFDYRVSGNRCDHAIKIVYPFYNTPRLLAQDGAFTIHSHPGTPIEDYKTKSFKEMNLDIAALYWWRVPKTNKADIIKGLSGLGITNRSVYPDLDGIAKSLWETEVLWRT